MVTKERIPFVDLLAQHTEVREQIDAAIADILNTSSFIGGEYVTQFEIEFAQYLGVKEVIGVGNGTDALWMALCAAGVGPGDGVITVPNTFIATVEAITRTGAYPFFVDIDQDTANMSPQALDAFLEKECIFEKTGRLVHRLTRNRIAAVIPVHLYGLPADMSPIIELCRQYGLAIIEDACQAHGAKYRMDGVWRKAGSIGTAAGFSFYPGKNLGAMGDAGAVATNDAKLAEHFRILRNHGSLEKYNHISSNGWNARLDTIQAAVLSIKLRKLDEWNLSRRRAARWYGEFLSALPLELPYEPEGMESAYHLYVIKTGQRGHLQRILQDYGIETGIHYPTPLHLQKAYSWLGIPPGSFPHAERAAQTILSLPMHPYLTQEQVERIGSICADVLQGS